MRHGASIFTELTRSTLLSMTSCAFHSRWNIPPVNNKKAKSNLWTWPMPLPWHLISDSILESFSGENEFPCIVLALGFGTVAECVDGESCHSDCLELVG